jgi:hypothetical protein
MFPYAEFLIDFDRRHGKITHQNAPENTRAAIIVEARPHFFLPMVVRNAMHFLGAGWNLHVLTGEMSHDFVQGFLQGWSVRVTKLPGVGRLSTADYNALLLSPSFWESFAEDKLLVFQTDAIVCGPNVEEFMGFDYVGAPCGTFDERYIANGGLSLRTRRVMLDCLARVFCPVGTPEDVFFTNAVRKLGARMPDMRTATRFAVESLYTGHPFGVHGTDKGYHSVETAQKITRSIVY